MDKSKLFPFIAGSVIAIVLAFVPEMKPIACGGGFTLPFLVR